MELKNPFPPAGSMVIRGTPIVIYQMGRVGSQTIRESLRKLDLPNSIHHIHYLSATRLKKETRYLSRHGLPVCKQLEQGKLVRKYLDTAASPALKVITVVREPVSQLISSLFENLQIHCPEGIRDDDSLDVATIQSYMRDAIEHYDTATAENCNWFDKDFLPALNIDVYSHIFDQQRGNTQFKQGEIDLLILRLENSETWGTTISRFLQLYSPMQITTTNASRDKAYRHAFEYVSSNLRFSSESLKRVYSSRYCQHFYSPEMIQQFIGRWSNSERMAA